MMQNPTNIEAKTRQPITASAVGNPFFFTGRRYDWQTRLYDYRTRYYDPVAGRFTSQDSIPVWGDEGILGNGFAYCGNNPASFLDAYGLAWYDFENISNWAAGYGDVISFGGTRWIRDRFPDYFQQDYDSTAYRGGEWTGMVHSLALGGGRLAYAGLARTGFIGRIGEDAALISVEEAVDFRNALKVSFNLGINTRKKMTVARALFKYAGEYTGGIDAARRTSPEFNAVGGHFFLAGNRAYQRTCK
jgi:RHS repeat-associated protein